MEFNTPGTPAHAHLLLLRVDFVFLVFSADADAILFLGSTQFRAE